jgi:hypothetical protein
MTYNQQASVDAANDAADALPGLLDDILITHVFPHFDPADLGILRGVSRGMRDAVDATGREIRRLSDHGAALRGYLSLLKDRHTRGVLSSREWLRAAAARNGDLEELKVLGTHGWPIRKNWTCGFAAAGGHLETLRWLRANGCPWGKRTCRRAAERGHLEVLKWLRENGCPWNE